jgi:hypothetical protein
LNAPKRAKFSDPHGAKPIDLGFNVRIGFGRHQAAS